MKEYFMTKVKAVKKAVKSVAKKAVAKAKVSIIGLITMQTAIILCLMNIRDDFVKANPNPMEGVDTKALRVAQAFKKCDFGCRKADVKIMIEALLGEKIPGFYNEKMWCNWFPMVRNGVVRLYRNKHEGYNGQYSMTSDGRFSDHYEAAWENTTPASDAQISKFVKEAKVIIFADLDFTKFIGKELPTTTPVVEAKAS
jgi:hypothetical protein